MTSPVEPIVCTLSTAQAVDRVDEWSDLRDLATSIEQLSDGVRFRVPTTHRAACADLAERESQCCAFLSISIESDTVGAASFEMTIRSPNPDGVPVVHLMAGITQQ